MQDITLTLLSIGAAVGLLYLSTNKKGSGMHRPNKISDKGIAFIKKHEGLRLETYLDGAGVPTIGYGHTGPDVHANMKISESEAEQLLRQDIARFEKAVNSALAVMIPLTQHEYDALVSFAFNVGATALKNSTLIKRFNAGDKQGAANEFTRWVYITQNGEKVVSFGLQNRREAEKKLFLQGDYNGA